MTFCVRVAVGIHAKRCRLLSEPSASAFEPCKHTLRQTVDVLFELLMLLL